MKKEPGSFLESNQTKSTDQKRERKKREAVTRPKQSWRSVVGLLGDSKFEREAWALGEAWRKEQSEP